LDGFSVEEAVDEEGFVAEAEEVFDMEDVSDDSLDDEI
jgi:hypothetical protein